MSILTVYQDKQSSKIRLRSQLPLEITELLQDAGVLYRTTPWRGVTDSLVQHVDEQTDLKREIVPLERQHQFPFVSLAVIDGDLYPNLSRLRMKYLSEHTVDKDEILYLLEGELLLSFHHDNQVFQLQAQSGSLLVLPAGLPRWMDIGTLEKRLVLMRCTQQEQEAVLHYTGSNLADMFPRLS